MPCQLLLDLSQIPGYDPTPPGYYDRPDFYTALSVKQPFASMIARGEKTIELRSWTTKYRGPLLICAGAKPFSGLIVVPAMNGSLTVDNARQLVKYSPADYPLGVAVCLVDLTSIRPMVPTDELLARFKFDSTLFAWEFQNVRPVDPLSVRGSLKFFQVFGRSVRLQLS